MRKRKIEKTLYLSEEENKILEEKCKKVYLEKLEEEKEKEKNTKSSVKSTNL